MSLATCPECGQAIDLTGPSGGQRITCPHCQTRLEVLNSEPLELDWVYNEPQLMELWQEYQSCQG